MQCSFCQAWNPVDEHRCGKCGRRLPAPNLTPVSGALAEAPALQQDPGAKIIPFLVPRPSPKPPMRAQTGVARMDSQKSLDFLPPAPQSARRLKTKVEAVVYCDSPVATPMHRAMASALDLSMIAIAFGIFVVTFHLTGGRISFDRTTLLLFGAALLAISLFYGFVWVLANAETAGMRWMHLRFINFDGFRPNASQRMLRFLGACLSFCTIGLGLLWSLVDEESLTWHDHMSKTFPTIRRPETNFYRCP